MLIVTTNELPGHAIDEVMGEVFGLTVRSRNLGSQIGASFKSIVGGELKGMTKMLADGRKNATERLIEEAERKGANAVLAFRFDTSELGSMWTEICAYGTAVRARKSEAAAQAGPSATNG
ncbi:MAG: YbjQ family protein [Solirubrobacteraceae bacterium]